MFDEQFVNFDISLMLKEVGYDRISMRRFDADKPEMTVDFWYTKVPSWYFESNKIVIAPLWQEVEEWLRDKFGINISYCDFSHPDTPYAGIRYYITQYGYTEVPYSSDFIHYKDARIEAITKAINLIKE